MEDQCCAAEVEGSPRGYIDYMVAGTGHLQVALEVEGSSWFPGNSACLDCR